jgi:hypothetical protein
MEEAFPVPSLYYYAKKWKNAQIAHCDIIQALYEAHDLK